MQALKVLVIAMGIAILAGVAVIGVTIYKRATEPRDETAAAPAPPPAFGTVEVPIPEGCSVVETLAAGERLILRIGTGAACDRIYVVDLASGALLGVLLTTPVL
ncbi:MAG: hypothetical protein ACE5KL_04350 [Alphaproteobacteria bacterium]